MNQSLPIMCCEPKCCCDVEQIPFASCKTVHIDFSGVINVNADWINVIGIKAKWETPNLALNSNVIEINEIANITGNIINKYNDYIYNVIPKYNFKNIKNLHTGEVITTTAGLYISEKLDENGNTIEYLQYRLIGSEKLKPLSDKLIYTDVTQDISSLNGNCGGFNPVVALKVCVTPKMLIHHRFRIDVTVETLDCNCNSNTFTKCLILTVAPC